MKTINNIQEIYITGLVNGMAFKTNPNSPNTFIYSEGTELATKTVYLVTYEKEVDTLEGLTELETKVVSVLKHADDYNGFPTACSGDLTDWTKIKTTQLRGVLASLLKKEVLHEGEYPNGMTAFHLSEEFC